METMTDSEILFILGVILLIIGVWMMYKQKEAEKIDTVKQTSERYQYLLHLPQELGAEVLELNYAYQRHVKSKAQLDYLNLFEQMKKSLADDMPPSELIQKGLLNQRKMKEFQRRISEAPPYRQWEKERYADIEKQLTAQLEEQAKPVIPTFTFTFYYVSPKGRNQYRRDLSFSAEKLQSFAKEIKKAEKKAAEHKQSAKYERSRMTNSLRYDVMKRDGFRCVLCGARAEDGVRLHVDHIRPVSKGGRTEMKNLRTLCECCNLGKRDKFDESGIN